MTRDDEALEDLAASDKTVRFFEPPGKPVSRGCIRSSVASGICKAAEKLDWWRLCGFFAEDTGSEEDPGSHKTETVVLDAWVSCPQKSPVDIREHERIAVVCDPKGGNPPAVLALRADFPQVPHLNPTAPGGPKHLCLFTSSEDEVMMRWAPTDFLLRIHEWFSLTAKGRLHQPDQGLEPFFLNASLQLFLSPEVSAVLDEDEGTAKEGVEKNLFVLEKMGSSRTGLFFRTRSFAEIASQRGWRSQGDADAAVVDLHYPLILWFPEIRHDGIVRKVPETVRELMKLGEEHGVDVLGSIKKQVRYVQTQIPQGVSPVTETRFSEFSVSLFVVIPVVESPSSAGAASARRVLTSTVFLLENTSLEHLGAMLGLWELHEGSLGQLISSSQPVSEEIGGIRLHSLTPVRPFSRAYAQRASMLPSCDRGEGGTDTPLHGVIVGVGAMGSQVLLDLVRMGFGRWTAVDDDCFLPHNLGRHTLFEDSVGFSKVSAVAKQANAVLNEPEKVVSAVYGNVVRSNDELAEAGIRKALADADFVVDASASVAAARYLALTRVEGGRRASVFLNPSGTDSVLLCEDRGRTIRLDSLEMQYYRMILERSDLHNHLRQENGQIPYGGACREVSSRIAQGMVGLHAGICSLSLVRSLRGDGAHITVWSSDENTLEVKRYDAAPSPERRLAMGDWTLVYDLGLVDRLSKLRTDRLPNETGGVLLGSYDVKRRIVYVVMGLPSPADSYEYPNQYIRGMVGLGKSVETASERTSGNLGYVGEWHSHPDGHGVSPSDLDRKQLEWVADHLSVDELPALLCIVGEDGECGFLLRLGDRSFESTQRGHVNE